MRKQRGFSIAEALAVSGVMILMGGLLLQSTRLSAKTLRSVQDASSASIDARASFEAILNDIRQADRVLTGYPSSSPTFSTNKTNTIVLRRPVYDAEFKPIPGNYDITIYKLERPSNTAKTARIDRYTAKVEDGAEQDAAFDRTVLKSAIAFNFRYSTKKMHMGDNWTQTFWNTGYYTPTTTDPLPAEADANLKNWQPALRKCEYVVPKKVRIGGFDAFAMGKVSLSGSSVVFDQAPAWSAPIDVELEVDPVDILEAPNSSGANNVFVEIRFPVESIKKSAVGRNDLVTYSSSVQLRNR